MKPDPKTEAQRWLAQARDDLRDARILAEAGSHPAACFYAQQTAEKALKAALIAIREVPWGHSVDKLLQALSDHVELPDQVSAASTLDGFYIPTRYPNGLPAGGEARNAFKEEQSCRALELAEGVVEFAARQIEG